LQGGRIRKDEAERGKQPRRNSQPQCLKIGSYVTDIDWMEITLREGKADQRGLKRN